MPLTRTTVLRIAFWTAAAVSLFMAELPKPPSVPGDPSDKLQHFAAFAVLAALGAAAYPLTSLVLIGVGLSLFGAAIELIQMIPAISRDASFWDWFADTSAVVAVLFLVHRMRGRRSAGLARQR